MSTNIGSLIGLLCGGVFILVFMAGGIFLIIKYRNLKRTDQSSQTWPSTSGQVMEVDVDRSQSSDSEGDTVYSYAPRVVYTYQVNGQTFTSKSLTFGAREMMAKQAKAQEIAARYRPGQMVTVFYDPANPSEAALERRTSGSTATLIIGIAFLAVGLCLTCPLLYLLVIQVSGMGSGL